ncbi:hypothetical protein JAAARDRAFT_194868 [Jaapia argillacea MUCL 33604]|uniref:Uncharacterized protein n=1 Tax=Jaapia argillacea MUCL 33604 TaxID=933084 RepID=A0A067Q2Y2_9AGAM|nr:hypothetical protein JAAARDRAFT_194868 [Jaapia argillacea MUCL 33604]
MSANTQSSAASHVPKTLLEQEIEAALIPSQTEAASLAVILEHLKANLVPGGVEEFEATWMPYVRARMTEYYSVLSQLPKIGEDLGVKLTICKQPILIHFEELVNHAADQERGLIAEDIYALNPLDDSVVRSGKPMTNKVQQWAHEYGCKWYEKTAARIAEGRRKEGMKAAPNVGGPPTKAVHHANVAGPLTSAPAPAQPTAPAGQLIPPHAPPTQTVPLASIAGPSTSALPPAPSTTIQTPAAPELLPLRAPPAIQINYRKLGQQGAAATFRLPTAPLPSRPPSAHPPQPMSTIPHHPLQPPPNPLSTPTPSSTPLPQSHLPPVVAPPPVNMTSDVPPPSLPSGTRCKGKDKGVDQPDIAMSDGEDQNVDTSRRVDVVIPSDPTIPVALSTRGKRQLDAHIDAPAIKRLKSAEDPGEEEEGDHQEEHSEYESDGAQMEAPTDLSVYNILVGFRGYDTKWTESLTHVFKHPCTGCTNPHSCCTLYRLPTTLAPSITCLYCKAKKRRCICSSNETIPNPHYDYTAKPIFVKKVDNKGAKPKAKPIPKAKAPQKPRANAKTRAARRKVTSAEFVQDDEDKEEPVAGPSKLPARTQPKRASVKTVDYPDPKVIPGPVDYPDPKVIPGLSSSILTLNTAPGGGSFVSQFQYDALKRDVDAL